METETSKNNKCLNLPNILEKNNKPICNEERNTRGNEKSKIIESTTRSCYSRKEIELFDELDEEKKMRQHNNMSTFKKQDVETESSSPINNNIKKTDELVENSNNTKIGSASSFSYNNNYYSSQSQILTKNFEASTSLEHLYAKVRYLSRKNLRKRRNVSKMILNKMRNLNENLNNVEENINSKSEFHNEENKIKLDSNLKETSTKLSLKLVSINHDNKIYENSKLNKKIKSIEKLKQSQDLKKKSNNNQHMNFVYANNEMPLKENLDLTKSFENNGIIIFGDDKFVLNRRNFQSINNSGAKCASRNSNNNKNNRNENKEKLKTKFNSKHKNFVLNTNLNNEINSLVKNRISNFGSVASTIGKQQKTTEDNIYLDKNESHNTSQNNESMIKNLYKNLYLLNSKQIETQTKMFHKTNASDLNENRKSTSPFKSNNLVFGQGINSSSFNSGNLVNISEGTRSLASSKSQYRNSNMTGIRHRNRVACLRSKSKLESIKVNGLGIDQQNLGSESNSNSDASLNRKKSPVKTKLTLKRDKVNRLESFESIKNKGELTHPEHEIEGLIDEFINDSLKLPELHQRKGKQLLKLK